MNLSSLDFNILKHLLVLLEEKNVSNAAKRAGVSQPAMSKSLKKLREIFKDDLLIEVGKDYALTETGFNLKDRVSEVLKDMNKILNPQEPFDPSTESMVIKIVSSDYGNLLYLPKVLEKLKDYPSVKLEIYSPQEQDLNRLQEEDVDFYLGIGKISLLPSTLIVKKIFSDHLLSAIGKNHPLAKKNITIKDFVKYPHMLISNLNLNTGKISSIYNRGILDEKIEELGFKREVGLVIPHFSTAPLLLLNSNYILSAPSKVIKYFETIIDIKTFATPVKEVPEAEFYLAWHALSLKKRSNVWFKENIIDLVTL